jgi:hypothetical protein
MVGIPRQGREGARSSRTVPPHSASRCREGVMDRPRAIRREIEAQLGYDLWRTLGGICPSSEFDVTCQGSVREAITAFLKSDGVGHSTRDLVRRRRGYPRGDRRWDRRGVPWWCAGGDRRRSSRALPHLFRDVITEFGRRFGSRLPINR